jgi:hypothetical protein
VFKLFNWYKQNVEEINRQYLELIKLIGTEECFRFSHPIELPAYETKGIYAMADVRTSKDQKGSYIEGFDYIYLYNWKLPSELALTCGKESPVTHALIELPVTAGNKGAVKNYLMHIEEGFSRLLGEHYFPATSRQSHHGDLGWCWSCFHVYADVTLAEYVRAAWHWFARQAEKTRKRWW